jgi:hypothetical protein
MFARDTAAGRMNLRKHELFDLGILNGVTDFQKLIQRHGLQTAKNLNDRPIKTLDFRTPKEVLFDSEKETTRRIP